MTLFWRFLDPKLPQILSDFYKIFARGSIQGDKNCVLGISEKFEVFQKRHVPKVCTFGPPLTSRLPLKMAEIEKNNYFLSKTLAIELSKYRKIKAITPLAFPGKIRLLFALVWLFLAGSRPR